MNEHGEDLSPSRRDIKEAEKSIQRGELRDPFFQSLERQFIELKGDEAKDPVLLARREREQKVGGRGAPAGFTRSHPGMGKCP